ncbi:MAG: spore germination protein [Solirubrobacterales bacterium]
MSFLRRRPDKSEKPNEPLSPAVSKQNSDDGNPPKTLEGRIAELREAFDRCDDFTVRQLVIGRDGTAAALVYISSLVDASIIENDLLRPLFAACDQAPLTQDVLRKTVLPVSILRNAESADDAVQSIAVGDVAFLTEGHAYGLIIINRSSRHRAIDAPTVETTIRGPQDAFNEQLGATVALIRQRLKTPDLAAEKLTVGSLTRTSVNLIYLKNLVMPGLAEETRLRIARIAIDGILDAGQLQAFIEDSPLSPFGTTEYTERPDRVCAALLEGRLAIALDNTPNVLIVPSSMASQLTSPEDYYNRFTFASAIRLIRYMALLIGLLAPATFVTLVSYHSELIPTLLLITIAQSRENIPFPAWMEALVMEATFELLREAGVRLPRAFGQTISIVGAIVIGQAAIIAGLASPAMVVIVSLTAIASYSIPSTTLANSIRLLRFGFIFAAAVFGLPGMMTLLVLLLFHLASLRSFGVPFLAPGAPLIAGDLKDSFVRFPLWNKTNRPRLTGQRDPVRVHPDLMPSPGGPRPGRNH